jgi:hypothetical protein
MSWAIVHPASFALFAVNVERRNLDIYDRSHLQLLKDRKTTPLIFMFKDEPMADQFNRLVVQDFSIHPDYVNIFTDKGKQTDEGLLPINMKTYMFKNELYNFDNCQVKNVYKENFAEMKEMIYTHDFGLFAIDHFEIREEIEDLQLLSIQGILMNVNLSPIKDEIHIHMYHEILEKSL